MRTTGDLTGRKFARLGDSRTYVEILHREIGGKVRVRYLHIRRGQERVVDEHELTPIPDDAPRCSVCGYASVDHDLTLTSTHVACGGMKFGGAPAPRPILTTEN